MKLSQIFIIKELSRFRDNKILVRNIYHQLKVNVRVF